MLAWLERDHVRELRHDFRVYYHVSYDEVPTEEAIDLITTLPQGSLWRGALHIEDSWTEEQYQTAQMIDLLMLINWRLSNCSDRVFAGPSTRPGDAERQKAAREKAHSVRKRIEEMQRG